MAREKKLHRFAVIDGGLGEKPKRKRRLAFACFRCRGRAYVVVHTQSVLPDGTVDRVRQHKQCLQCLPEFGPELT